MPIPRWLLDLEEPVQVRQPLSIRRGRSPRRQLEALAAQPATRRILLEYLEIGMEPVLVDRDPRLGGPHTEVVARPRDPVEQWQRFERWALRLTLQGVRLQEGKMVKTKEEIQAARHKADASHGRALESFRKLIADVLASEEPARFAEAARICAAAHGLVVARATRVGEMGEGALGQADMVMNALNAVPYQGMAMQQPLRGNVNAMGGYDMQNQRDAAAAAAMMQDAEARKRDAEASCAETLELARLSEMAESLGKAVEDAAKRHTGEGEGERAARLRRRLGAVEARIDQLTTRMEGRASAACDPTPGKGEDDADVVPADDPGRHQAHGRGARTGRGPAHGADGPGAVAD